MEGQRPDLIGQYLGSTTEKTNQKLMEARDDVLFIDEAYQLIPTAGGKDFGCEAIEELMAVMEDGNPVMIFARYKNKMEKFLHVKKEIFSSKGQTRGIPSGCQCGRNSRCVHVTCPKKKYE